LTAIIQKEDRESFLDRRPVFLPSLVWLLSLGAALFAMALRGVDIMPFLPIFAAASIPGVLGVALARIANREWVQILLMLSWAALALLGCLIFGFRPMALMFIAVPAAASLFEREKVLEGTLIAVLIRRSRIFSLITTPISLPLSLCWHLCKRRKRRKR